MLTLLLLGVAFAAEDDDSIPDAGVDENDELALDQEVRAITVFWKYCPTSDFLVFRGQINTIQLCSTQQSRSANYCTHRTVYISFIRANLHRHFCLTNVIKLYH